MLRVRYTGYKNNWHTFSLIDILGSSLPLYFDYCICSNKECKYVLGYTQNTYNNTCPVCGKRTLMVNNINTLKAYIR